MSDANKPTVGFIGLGLMGSRMAGRLLDAGYPLIVYNRTADKAKPLVDRGAKLAESPGELAERSAFVISMLTNGQAALQMAFGDAGTIAHAKPGTVLIEMSTVSPTVTRAIAEKAKQADLADLDAPVSGSTPQAEQGKLMIFVGGESAAFEKAQPILSVLGQPTHLGPSGSGSIMKVVVNALLGIGIAALSEATDLALKAGLDPARFFDTLSQTAVITPAQKGKIPNLRSGQYPTQFPLKHMHKDMGLALSESAAANAPLPLTAAAAQQITAAMSAGLGEQDVSAVAALAKKLSQKPA
ncbi:MAG TPA: NAD(P)-dependent oxidoreductase [Tepidisphaeraceae bacterium]|jgi:3-hydroxyisobutyrate dehydrogenase-like beta-hydroxyacid dehydrogenase|nr:NAD(P)-dependent oxidoreductase [Tepidisphaeraceae bacterium]